jgi:hypothetical protein
MRFAVLLLLLLLLLLLAAGCWVRQRCDLYADTKRGAVGDQFDVA